jgi:hypothetical protein
VTCVNEIRKFIYGGISQSEIAGFLGGVGKLGRMRGFIGFCPLMDSIERFQELDGWLVNVMKRALSERYRLVDALLKDTGKSALAKGVPTQDSLISGDWYDGPSKLELELGMPSFVLAWRAARKKYKQYGLDDFESPRYYSHASDFPAVLDHYDS